MKKLLFTLLFCTHIHTAHQYALKKRFVLNPFLIQQQFTLPPKFGIGLPEYITIETPNPFSPKNQEQLNEKLKELFNEQEKEIEDIITAKENAVKKAIRERNLGLPQENIDIKAAIEISKLKNFLDGSEENDALKETVVSTRYIQTPPLIPGEVIQVEVPRQQINTCLAHAVTNAAHMKAMCGGIFPNPIDYRSLANMCALNSNINSDIENIKNQTEYMPKPWISLTYQNYIPGSSLQFSDIYDYEDLDQASEDYSLYIAQHLKRKNIVTIFVLEQGPENHNHWYSILVVPIEDSFSLIILDSQNKDRTNIPAIEGLKNNLIEALKKT